MQMSMKVDGSRLSRGDYGDRVDRIHRIIYDGASGENVKALKSDDESQCEWGYFDSVYGWMPYDI